MYTISPATVLTHSPSALFLVRDSDDEPTDAHLFVDLEVSSGDYFATLATQLDNLSQYFAATEYDAVQELVANLLYLQDKYRIVKK